MDDHDYLTGLFEAQRGQLRAVAYRMLGSLSEADDAVQEAWIRLNRTDTADVRNMGGWLTTVVARICLNMLRSREHRREDPLEERLPDPVVSPADGVDPEQEALLADSVGLALLVVLQTLEPTERLAFVLHDMFAVPFEEIASIIDRTPAATRQLASRARRRVRGAAPEPDPDVSRQREVVQAFMAAAREGDFDTLVSLLHPDVVLRTDMGPTVARGWNELRGALTVGQQALMFRRMAPFAHPVLVNGVAGALNVVDGKTVAVGAFTIADGRIVSIDILADPARVAGLDPAALIGA
ncbi:putative RNA polymerase sigma factor [[Actinomadura] parvosata subsp. kistnae]|uniref:RNA polymerase subunit sigma-70 n=1 Tax=[Actinomadura] parvosata subsp. kistnae TaxID=1909395 RepID=A0A1V0AFP2_9ACTN|nr:RNA polymerase sigma factor SigJ [Nonomuraea sp. ATCC 55076]AQZ69027.1 RNA polymerase subunit sigma-70 [Nonomuraea sp. ATCC 55076]SPL92404.1 putative RNA polymerase sigma factor [Actinomadura parvosata subsp. kistnae]